MNARHSIQNICILRLSAIGDVCNALAMVQQLQAALPQAKVTWICGKAEAQLLSVFPSIECIVYDKKSGWRGGWQLRQQLKHRSFDVLLHMQAALRASLLSLAIPARRRIGFDRQRAKDGQWWFCNEHIAPAQQAHVLDGFMQFLAALNIKPQAPSWHIPLRSEDQQQAADWLGKGKNLLICPAASKAYKNWTVAGYAQLALHALSQGYQVHLIGSPAANEMDLAEQVNEACQQQLNNLCGKTQLPLLWALLAKADIVLSPDTGPAHMAVAVNTPVIGLYAHHNPQRTGPYYSQAQVVSVWQHCIEQQTGKSTKQLSWRSRVKDPKAMHHISAAAVISQFDQLNEQLS